MRIVLLHGLILVLLVSSCSRKIPLDPGGENNQTETPLYHTWNSLKEREYSVPPALAPKEIPPDGFFPWAGIVSHHLLTHDYLDAWFSRLAKIRQPRRFFILSPSHFGISTEPYSLTDGSWQSGFGLVESDTKKVQEMAEALEVKLDPEVFRVEHGVSVIMPYIKKYFREATVVAIAYEGEPPVNISAHSRLASILEKEFDEVGKKENFLLISADFSHHGNLSETTRRDDYSERYFKRADISWNMVGCDNRPGIFVLHHIGKESLNSCILYRTNSFEISAQWEDTITSYFFIYFSDSD